MKLNKLDTLLLDIWLYGNESQKLFRPMVKFDFDNAGVMFYEG